MIDVFDHFFYLKKKLNLTINYIKICYFLNYEKWEKLSLLVFFLVLNLEKKLYVHTYKEPLFL